MTVGLHVLNDHLIVTLLDTQVVYSYLSLFPRLRFLLIIYQLILYIFITTLLPIIPAGYLNYVIV